MADLFAPVPGLAPVFPGWNVWAVWQKNDLDFEISMLGVSADRRLRIWVENAVDDNAPGAAVGDPLSPNVTKFKGEMVQIVPSAGELLPVARKESVPNSVPALDGPPSLFFVRFYNRGQLTSLAWPHDGNHLLDAVYLPSPISPITNAPEPASAAATVDEAGEVVKGAAASTSGLLAGAAAVLALGLLLSRRR
jgi:hypothetical protein